jgi:hypothetical protein
VDSGRHNEADGTSEAEAPLQEESACDSGTPVGLTVAFIDNIHTPPSRDQSFGDVADHLRELQGIKCPARCTQWEYWLENQTSEALTIAVRCECQQVAKVIRMSPEAFAREAHKVLDP